MSAAEVMTPDPQASQAGLAVAYCVAILVLSVAAASWLFRHRVNQVG